MPGDDKTLLDGVFDFSGGVDSGRTPLVQSAANPNGLPRTSLAWLSNATVRGGAIQARGDWNKLATVVPAGIYQGGAMYDPSGASGIVTGLPYLMVSVGGRIYQIRVDLQNQVIDLSAAFGLVNPVTLQGFWCQGEQFMIIQAGDFGINSSPALPLFWDGATLRRSMGVHANSGNPPGVSELPAAGPMVYYMGRLWYAQGRTYTAGDIVQGPSGTAQYNFRDSILEVTENPLAIGGDGFAVPNSAGNITALFYPANLDTTLGQGPLLIGTRRQIYQLIVPVTRALWITSGNGATGTTNPLQTVVQQKYGPVGDRGVVPVNGDNFYETVEPGVRSFIMAQRQYYQWGNIPISRPEARVLNPKWQDRTLMGTTPAVNFDNRLLIGALPYLTPAGVAFQAIMPLDFDIISSFGHEIQTAEKAPPAWEGMWEGLDILQLFEGDFGGVQRCFAAVHSRVDGSIQIWEHVSTNGTDGNDTRIQFQAEFPAFDFGNPFELKEIDGIEIWIDGLYGQVDIRVEWRPDADPCWRLWNETRFCAARNSAESINSPVTYPITPFCEGQQFPVTFGPPSTDACQSMQRRPSTRGFFFQPRITVRGQARIRGIMLRATKLDQEPYENLTNSCATDIINPPPPSPPNPQPTPGPPAPPIPPYIPPTPPPKGAVNWGALIWDPNNSFIGGGTPPTNQVTGGNGGHASVVASGAVVVSACGFVGGQNQTGASATVGLVSSAGLAYAGPAVNCNININVSARVFVDSGIIVTVFQDGVLLVTAPVNSGAGSPLGPSNNDFPFMVNATAGSLITIQVFSQAGSGFGFGPKEMDATTTFSNV